MLFPPSIPDKAMLSLWFALLLVRGPSKRRDMEAFFDLQVKAEMSMIHDRADATRYLERLGHVEPDDETVSSVLDRSLNLDGVEFGPHQNDMVTTMLRLGAALSKEFFDRHVSVIKMPEPGLVLCDNPIVLYQEPGNRVSGVGVGVGNADELWVPLDRSTLAIFHRDAAIGDGVEFRPEGVDVRELNQAIVSSASKEVYCHPDDVDGLRVLSFPDPDRPISSIAGAEWLRGRVDGLNAAPRRRQPRRYRSPRSGS